MGKKKNTTQKSWLTTRCAGHLTAGLKNTPRFQRAQKRNTTTPLSADWPAGYLPIVCTAGHAGPCTFQGLVFPPAFTVPTLFFATGAYFWGQLSIYHMPDHAFIADKHDPAYYKRLIDPGSKHQLRKMRSAPQIRAGPRRGAPCGASRVVPRPVPCAGPNLCAPAPRAVRCGARNLLPALPRSEH